MSHVIVFDQYYPGGVHKQLFTATGVSQPTFNQYSNGGVAEQARIAIGSGIVYNQYAPGGCAEQLRAAGAALP